VIVESRNSIYLPNLGLWIAPIEKVLPIMNTTKPLAFITAGFAFCADATFAQSAPDRTVLPIKEPLRETTDVIDVRKATAPPRFEVKAPDGAPNVLLVLLDDLGFAGTSAFGGPVATPNFDRITAGGLKYNNFHTTAVCSPTRTALKSGRNHHVNNMGGIIETGTAFLLRAELTSYAMAGLISGDFWRMAEL
jgi:hypothetical protein